MKKITKKCVLLFSTLVLIVTFASFSYAIKEENVIGMWLLEDGKGNEVLDSSGNGNNGKVLGGLKWGKGKFGSSIDFVGGDSVEISNQDAFVFDDNKSFSVVTWINFKSAQDWNRIVRGRNPGAWQGGNTGWELQTQGLSIHWSLDDVAKNHVRNTFDNVGTGEWRHTAMIVDREKKKLISYIDGGTEKVVDIANIKSITSGTPVIFGGGFVGSIDEVAIFNIAITQDDVKNIMDKGLKNAIGAKSVDPLSKLSITWGNIKK
jgi:hypothetical protein